jgi:hypothetical protein
MVGHLLTELGVFGLELRELIARRLPFLARSGPVLVIAYRGPRVDGL